MINGERIDFDVVREENSINEFEARGMTLTELFPTTTIPQL